MTSQQISIRINKLRTAIAYSRWKGKHMSVGEGIMCQQEIASWFAVLAERTTVPRYTVAESIDIKVKEINERATLENWINPSELI